MLAKTFTPTTLDVDFSFYDLISRINLLISLLKTSLTCDFIVNLNEEDLRGLWGFFRSISVSFYFYLVTCLKQDAPMKNSSLLAISLQAVVLLLVFSKTRGFEHYPVDFLAILLSKALTRRNLYWTNDLLIRSKNEWGASIVLLIDQILW